MKIIIENDTDYNSNKNYNIPRKIPKYLSPTIFGHFLGLP